MNSEPLGIVELVDVCARMQAQNLDLFRELGAWVAVADVEHQRWYATACHRHAWHAELWAERSPSIPRVETDTTAGVRQHQLPADPDADAYRSLLTRLLAELDELSHRVHAELDPGSHRVLALVRHDLGDLRTT